MKLAAKLITVLVSLIVVILIVDTTFTLVSGQSYLEEDEAVDARKLANIVKQMIQNDEPRDKDQQLELFKAFDQRPDNVTIRLVICDGSSKGLVPRVAPNRIRFGEDGDVSLTAKNQAGETLRVTYVSFDQFAEGAAIELTETNPHGKRATQFFLFKAAVIAISTVLLSTIIVIALGAAWVGRPLERMIDKTKRIGAGDLTGPIQLVRNDELGELATAIDDMCNQLYDAREKAEAETQARESAEEQLRHADRLRTVGRLAAGIAHELGTPLNVISGRAELIESGRLDSEQTVESAKTIRSETKRITEIIRQLLDFARREEPHRQSKRVAQLIDESVSLLTPLAERHDISLEILPIDNELRIDADPSQMLQVLTNLIVNAGQATGSQGTVRLSADLQQQIPPEQNTPQSFVRIDVADDGSGISKEHLPHVFEPFFTTKEVGSGTGLGLSVAYGIVRDHDGWISVTSQPGEGSVFSIFLPAGATG